MFSLNSAKIEANKSSFEDKGCVVICDRLRNMTIEFTDNSKKSLFKGTSKKLFLKALEEVNNIIYLDWCEDLEYDDCWVYMEFCDDDGNTTSMELDDVIVQEDAYQSADIELILTVEKSFIISFKDKRLLFKEFPEDEV